METIEAWTDTTERIAKLERRVPDLESERRNGGPPEAEDAVEFWDREAGPFEPYALVHRSVFGGPQAARLRQLLKERAELINMLKEHREERERKLRQMHRLAAVKRGAARPFPGEGLRGDDPLTEGEAEARLQELDDEVDALAPKRSRARGVA